MTLGELRQTIGPYEVQEVIGHGGMATVYRGLQPELDRTVALKVLLPAYLNDDAFRARFQREARLIARLRHPNIVGVYDVSEDDGQPYLVMEYLEGITLHSALVERRRFGQVFSVDEALDLLRPLASALDYAHSRSIVHRDLKPENIILTADGPVITDFGLAKLLQEESATVSIVIGTPAYMAPEQIEAQSVDARTDVYAFGIMLYELLSGRVPYEGSSPVAVAQAHLNQPIPSLASLVPNHDLSFEIDAVAQRAIAKDKADRWPSAGALVQALEAAASAGSGPPAERPTVPFGAAPVPRLVRPPRRESRGVLVLLIPLLALGLAGLWGARYLASRSVATSGTEQPQPATIVAGEAPGVGDEPMAGAATATVASTLVASPTSQPSAVPSPEGTVSLGISGGGATTATPAPTAEATPTPSSSPTPDTAVRGVVQAPAGAFLRSGPGTGYPVIGGLRDQATVVAMQQADGWLEISAATGERGWLAAALFDLHSGDVGSLPQAELPPLAQVPTQAPVPTDPPVAPAQSGAVLRLEDSAFTGGFRNKGASVYGGRTATWVYGQGSGYSSMAATFIVDQAAPGVARLTIEGMDSEDRAKSPLRIGINGITLFEGASPFPNDDLPLDTGRWAALPLEFDAASLRPGVNTITITNLSQGTVGLPPFVALDYVVIELP